MVEVASRAVYDVLCEGAFDAFGELLVDSGCVEDDSEGREVYMKLSDKFGEHGLVEPKLAVRSLATPLRMVDGMDQNSVPKKQPVELQEGPTLTQHDRESLKGKRGRMNVKERSGWKKWYRETTFLRHMAMHAIDGIPKNCHILHVEQEVGGDDTSALQCFLMRMFLKEEAHLIALQRDLEFKSATEKSNTKPNEALDKDAISQKLEQVYKSAYLLTLNDFQGLALRIILIFMLLNGRKKFIVVSHAREFSNTVVTDILHLQAQKLIAYKGDYDTFERTREEQMKNQQKAFDSSEKAKAHMQAIERLGTVDEVINDPDYKFEFPTPDDRPGAPIVSLSDASFGYPGGLLFKNLNFGIDLDSRIAMVGPKGIGKSIILKLISGELQLSSGTVFQSAKVCIAVFSQHQVRLMGLI
ncbi:hypothetical protein MKW98_009529 [Papaver atlanticum]|uniref:ABC transporter domain-containing protein n=1 Tax=Papaver atlanticum TaxID=357466 RepID=A0AAD4SG24_9MAGN|nr:hypothetical protein MKW98_009529 [Papaver atlanticum]